MVKTNTYFLLLSLILCFSVNAIGQSRQPAVVLSTETIGKFDIVIYNGSSIIQQFAAQELQHYLEKIFKVKPEIKNKSHLDKTGNYFLLGEGFLIDSLQQPDGLPKDAFVKAFRGKNIYLGGKDDLDAIGVKKNFFRKAEKANFGTLYAVYDFLENNLGVHWFFPTYLGEYIPNKKAYTIDEKTSVTKPAFTVRAFGRTLYSNPDTVMLWMLRNKITYLKNPTVFVQRWYKIIPPGRYFHQDPKLFAKYDGTYHQYTRHGGPAQLNTENINTINLYIKNTLQYARNHPSQQNFSLSPNDGGSFSESYDGLEPDNCNRISPTYSKLSCRIFRFYRKIYDSIYKYYPKLNIGGLAYQNYAVAPKNDILPNNFQLWLAINNIGFGNRQCSTTDTLFNIIKTWKHRNNNGFYCFPYGNSWIYPILRTKMYQELIQQLADNNFNKVILHFYPEWYSKGLDIWLITKMLWNPNINIDSLMNVYYYTLYPVSHLTIESFHKALQKNTNNLNVCVPEYHLPGRKKTGLIFNELFKKTLLTKTEDNIRTDLREDKLLSEKERFNLQNFRKMIQFLKLEKQGYTTGIWGNLRNYSGVFKKIEILKGTLILNDKSKYWNPKISPSVYIHKFNLY